MEAGGADEDLEDELLGHANAVAELATRTASELETNALEEKQTDEVEEKHVDGGTADAAVGSAEKSKKFSPERILGGTSDVFAPTSVYHLHY